MTILSSTLRGFMTLVGLIIVWQVVILVFDLPKYIVPSPALVYHAFIDQFDYFMHHLSYTALAIVLAIIVGVLGGAINGLALLYLPPLRRWILPILLASQAIPMFAIAPLLVLWFGYGLLPKVLVAVMIIFFPVTITFYDGLRRLDKSYLQLANTLGATPWTVFRHIRLPACLPLAGSGIRMAATLAPIGVIIGEWVGSSKGMGYILLEANGRMKPDVMFAGIFIICIFTVMLYTLADKMMRHLITWENQKNQNS